MNSVGKTIYEKSNSIEIPKNMKQIEKKQYSLKQDVFDPFSCSPPNHFMVNLRKRMSTYNSFVINDDNRNSE
jgi:hypothetical protein